MKPFLSLLQIFILTSDSKGHKKCDKNSMHSWTCTGDVVPDQEIKL